MLNVIHIAINAAHTVCKVLNCNFKGRYCPSTDLLFDDFDPFDKLVNENEKPNFLIYIQISIPSNYDKN